MTVVEFLGGPLDGLIRDLPDVPSTYRVPVMPKITMMFDAEIPQQFIEPKVIEYRRNRFKGGPKDGMIVYTVRPYAL